MAVIKSAIELAMERTRSLVLGEEEKRALAEKEIEVKVRAAVRRYLEGMTEIDGVTKELDGVNADKNLKRLVFIDLFIDKFDIKEKNGRLLELFNIVCSDLEEPLKREFEMLQQRFAEQMERKEILIRKEITERLNENGVSGNGLEPNIEVWDEWKEGMEEVRDVFKGRFAEWEEKLV
jgi:hypothetical protein